MAHRGTFVGTALFASPEMLEKSSSGPFTDIWALGLIIYNMLVGQLPWKATFEAQLFQEIVSNNI